MGPGDKAGETGGAQKYVWERASMSNDFRSNVNRHFFLVLSDFFIDLDRRLGPLTSYSSVRELVRYVQAGIKKLRAL